MSQTNRHIDELFREELGSYTELPAPAVWASLETRLDGHYKKPVSYRWIWYALLALLTAVILFFAVRSFTAKHESTGMITEPVENTKGYADNNTGLSGNGAAIQNETEHKHSEKLVKDYDDSETEEEHADKAIAAAKTNDDKTKIKSGKQNSVVAGNNKKGSQNSKNIPASKEKGADKKTTDVTLATKDDKVDVVADKSASLLPSTEHEESIAKKTTGNTKNNKSAKQQAKKNREPVIADTKNVLDETERQEIKKQVSKTEPKAIAARSKNNKKADKQNSNTDNINDTNIHDEMVAGGSITAKPANTGNNKLYGSATRNRKNTSANNNKPAAQKKTSNTASKQNKQDNISENDVPEWKVKPSTAASRPKEQKTSKADNKPERDWKTGFVSEDTREAHAIKLKDVPNSGINTGGGDDNAKDDEEEKSGGGGGGATAGYDEKDKKKKDKTGKKFMFEFGVKLGYEIGFGTYKANKGVIMPYLQYNLAPTIGLVIQPSLKYAGINTLNIGDPASYYNITATKLDSNHIVVPGDSLNPGTIVRRYYYSQSHDSMFVKRAITKKTYFEFELPVMLQYKLAKNFSAYFGISVNYSKIAQIEEQKYTATGIMRYDTLQFPIAKNTDPAPVVPPADGRFSYNSEPFSNYNAAPVQNATTNPVRFNYMIGFNYLFANRILLDVMYTKSLSNPNYIPDTRVREIYKQGYLRVSLGYKLSK